MGALENWIVFALSNQQQAEEAKKRGDIAAAKKHAEYASVGQSWALGYMNTPDGPNEYQKIVPTVTTALGAVVGGIVGGAASAGTGATVGAMAGAAVGSAAGNYAIGVRDTDYILKSSAIAAGSAYVGAAAGSAVSGTASGAVSNTASSAAAEAATTTTSTTATTVAASAATSTAIGAGVAAGGQTYMSKNAEDNVVVIPEHVKPQLITPDLDVINAKRRAERLAMGRQGSIKTSSLGLPGGGATFAGKQLLGS